MRKILEAVSLAALAVLAWVTVGALAGPHRLPGHIPARFDLAGRPVAWSTPDILFLLPLVSAGLYVLITLVSRFPSAFNFPVRVSPRNRPRLEAIALDMTAWLKAELLCLFAWIQTAMILSARRDHSVLSPALMPIAICVIFATIGWHFVAIWRAARIR